LRVLVTGGAGFIGSHIVDALLANDVEVIVVDDLSNGNLNHLHRSANFHQIDITSPDLITVFEGGTYSAVVHAAAIASVTKSITNPDRDRAINLDGTAKIIRLCQAYGNPRVVFLSSGGAIYGETPIPADERTLPAPISYYGIHKYCAELYLDISGLPFCILRLANVYGPRQAAGLEGGVVAILLEKLKTGQPFDIFGNGEQQRDFVYVDDVVQAILSAITGSQSGIWNIGTGIKTSVNHLVKTVELLTGSTIPVRNMPARTGEIINSCLSVERSRSSGWWSPRYSLIDGLREIIRM
jgi:UDP-glucose 4-epimerase